jgi:hypothetical protein
MMMYHVPNLLAFGWIGIRPLVPNEQPGQQEGTETAVCGTRWGN